MSVTESNTKKNKLIDKLQKRNDAHDAHINKHFTTYQYCSRAILVICLVCVPYMYHQQFTLPLNDTDPTIDPNTTTVPTIYLPTHIKMDNWYDPWYAPGSNKGLCTTSLLSLLVVGVYKGVVHRLHPKDHAWERFLIHLIMLGQWYFLWFHAANNMSFYSTPQKTEAMAEHVPFWSVLFIMCLRAMVFATDQTYTDTKVENRIATDGDAYVHFIVDGH
jgi:hypothetical protein